MSAPGCLWMLSTCGQVAALPAGVPAKEALSTGPVYEQVLRSNPTVKLVFTHTPSASVNEAASVLAGHAVHGDACLAVSPTPGLSASPAVLLDGLLRPSTRGSHHHHHQQQRLSQLGPVRPRGSVQEHPLPHQRAQRHHRRGGAGVVAPLPQEAGTRVGHGTGQAAAPPAVSPDMPRAPVRPPAAAAAAPAALSEDATRQWWRQGQAEGPAASLAAAVAASPGSAVTAATQRHVAMQVILGSRNAAARPLPSPPQQQLRGAPRPAPLEAASSSVDGVPSAAFAAAAAMPSVDTHAQQWTGAAAVSIPALGMDPWVAGWSRARRDELQGRPCKSARSSREYDPLWRAAPGQGAERCLAGSGGRESDLPVSPRGVATHCPVVPEVVPEEERPAAAAEAAVEGSAPGWPSMGRESAGGSCEAAEAAWMEVDGAGAAGCCEEAAQELEAPGTAAVGAAVGMDLESATPLVAKDCGTGVGRRVGKDPGVQGGHQQQQPEAEQDEDKAAQQEQEERCGAEAAPPGDEAHAPWVELPGDVVGCVALQLPPQASQVQAMAAVCRGWRDAILAHVPVLRRATFRLDPTSHLRSPRSSSSTRRRCADPPADPSAPDGAAAAAQTPPQQQQQEEEEEEGGHGAMAAAVVRQYAAGAFLLPSSGGARGPVEAQGAQEDVDDGEREPAMAVPGQAVRSLPRLLLAAAHAANPSALLVVAQLFEGSGDAGGSLRWWRKLAQLGDVMGMFKMGMALYDGSHGMQPDPEAAHVWLGRTVRTILRVDSLTAISVDSRGQQGRAGPAPAALQQQHQQHQQQGLVQPGGGAAAAAAARVPAALAGPIAALDTARLRMLALSAIVLGYLEFDGVAGRATWGMADRSGAVRMFRLAEACGLTEASTVLGWLYNTGQY